MKILISGYGSHAKRRIIPALLKSKKVKDIHIISRNRDNEKDNLNIKFVDLNLKDNKLTNYDYVIISSPPYAHNDNLLTLKSISNNFINHLQKTDFEIDEKNKNVILTDSGVDKIEKLALQQNILKNNKLVNKTLF